MNAFEDEVTSQTQIQAARKSVKEELLRIIVCYNRDLAADVLERSGELQDAARISAILNHPVCYESLMSLDRQIRF